MPLVLQCDEAAAIQAGLIRPEFEVESRVEQKEVMS